MQQIDTINLDANSNKIREPHLIPIENFKFMCAKFEDRITQVDFRDFNKNNLKFEKWN